jgi:hypothetical protein
MTVAIGDVRRKLAIEPEKVYPKMLEAADAGDWSKFGKAFDLVADLVKEIDALLSSRLYLMLTTARDQRNAKMARQNTERLIIGSIKALLREAIDNPSVNRKTHCKQAFVELRILQPMATYKHLDLTTDFALALDSIEDDAKFEKIVQRILKELAPFK